MKPLGMIIGALLLILSFSLESFADSPIAAERVLEICVNNYQFSKSCNYISAEQATAINGPNYKEGFGDTVIMYTVGAVAGKITRAIEAAGLGTGKCRSTGAGDYIYLESLVSLLKHAADSRKLSDCQRACLGLCASSAALLSSPTNLASPCASFMLGTGNCQDYSTLANYILKKMGLKSRVAGTNFHNFISVKLEDKWFHAEPQSSRCNFITP